ncbi:MAG: hypothetical protein WCH62_06220, partial [Candidatus Omnitrophota bacterium]
MHEVSHKSILKLLTEDPSLSWRTDSNKEYLFDRLYLAYSQGEGTNLRVEGFIRVIDDIDCTRLMTWMVRPNNFFKDKEYYQGVGWQILNYVLHREIQRGTQKIVFDLPGALFLLLRRGIIVDKKYLPDQLINFRTKITQETILRLRVASEDGDKKAAEVLESLEGAKLSHETASFAKEHSQQGSIFIALLFVIVVVGVFVGALYFITSKVVAISMAAVITLAIFFALSDAGYQMRRAVLRFRKARAEAKHKQQTQRKEAISRTLRNLAGVDPAKFKDVALFEQTLDQQILPDLRSESTILQKRAELGVRGRATIAQKLEADQRGQLQQTQEAAAVGVLRVRFEEIRDEEILRFSSVESFNQHVDTLVPVEIASLKQVK